MDETTLKRRLSALFRAQRLAVVATNQNGAPYASLVAFYSTADLRSILFATMRATSKYRNLSSEPRVCVLVDDRGNTPADIAGAVTASAIGRASEVGRGRARLERLFLGKHPYLAGFLRSPGCALICVRSERYIFVDRFQEVSVLEMD